MTKQDIENFIALCKAFELNPTVSQISTEMIAEFKKHELFYLLPEKARDNLKKLFSHLLPDEIAFGRAIGKAGIMLLCMSDERAAQLAAVKDAPKESLTTEYVCLNCGNLHHSINAPEKQGCCTVEKYIKNIL